MFQQRKSKIRGAFTIGYFLTVSILIATGFVTLADAADDNITFEETFDLSIIDSTNWVLFERKGLIEVVDKKLHILAKEGTISAVNTKKFFENDEYVLKFDVSPISKENNGYGIVVNHCRPEGDSYWWIQFGSNRVLSVFSLYRGEWASRIDVAGLPLNIWYRVKINNHKDSTDIKVTRLDTGTDILVKTVYHDDGSASPITFMSITDRPETLQGAYFDNIGWETSPLETKQSGELSGALKDKATKLAPYKITQNDILVEVKDTLITLENKVFRYSLDVSRGLECKGIFNKVTNRSCQNGSSPLFAIRTPKGAVDSSSFVLKDYNVSKNPFILNLELVLLNPLSLKATIAIEVREEDSEAIWSLTLQNQDKKAIVADIFFPFISGIRIGQDDRYFFPRFEGVVTDKIEKLMPIGYGGYASIQLLDIFNPSIKEGFLVYPRDKSGEWKVLSINKAGKEVLIGINYKEKKLEAGKDVILPPTVLAVHKGDWREALSHYKTWVDSWYQGVNVPDWFKESFNFARSNPPVGLDFNEGLTALMKRGEEFGGLDIIELYDYWVVPEGHSYAEFIVGDYSIRNDLGGVEALKEGIKKVHELGGKVIFYLAGVSVDKRSKIAIQAKEWAMMNKDGTYAVSYGPNHWDMCPFHKGWQEYLARTCAELIRQTDADGVRLDETGSFDYIACYNPNHHHNHPGIWIEGQSELIKKVRAAVKNVKENAVVLAEQPGCDIISQYLDGALYHTLQDAPDRVMVTPLRYVLPEFKGFACASFDHDVENYKRAFLNGQAFIYSPFYTTSGQLREFLSKQSMIMREHKDAFLNVNLKPQIMTSNPQLYVNLFPGNNKEILTLFNDSQQEISGKLVSLPYRKGYHVVDLLTNKEIETEIADDKILIATNLPSKEVGCIARLPQLIKLGDINSNKKQLTLEVVINPIRELLRPSLSISIEKRDEQNKMYDVWKQEVNLEAFKTARKITKTFSPDILGKVKIIVKIKDKGIVLDQTQSSFDLGQGINLVSKPVVETANPIVEIESTVNSQGKGCVELVLPEGVTLSTKGKVGIFREKAFPGSSSLTAEYLGNIFSIKGIESAFLNTTQVMNELNPGEYPIFILANSEYFPRVIFDKLCEYLKRGGCLINTRGVPFAIPVEKDGNKWIEKGVSFEFLNRLGLFFTDIYTKGCWDEYNPQKLALLPGQEVLSGISMIKEKPTKALEETLRGKRVFVPIVGAYYEKFLPKYPISIIEFYDDFGPGQLLMLGYGAEHPWLNPDYGEEMITQTVNYFLRKRFFFLPGTHTISWKVKLPANGEYDFEIRAKDSSLTTTFQKIKVLFNNEPSKILEKK